MAWTKKDLERSYECNSALLVQLRKRLGLTQSSLAKASGYTERLIIKAEAGQAISPTTIADLAEALSSSEKTVFPEDLISDPVSMAKRYIAATYIHQANAMREIRDFLDDDVVFRFAGDPECIPLAGERRGIAVVEALLKLFFSLVEAPLNHDFEQCYEYQAHGNVVFITGELWMHPKGVPLERPMPLRIQLKFRRGKLYEYDNFYDTQLGADVLATTQQTLSHVLS